MIFLFCKKKVNISKDNFILLRHLMIAHLFNLNPFLSMYKIYQFFVIKVEVGPHVML